MIVNSFQIVCITIFTIQPLMLSTLMLCRQVDVNSILAILSGPYPRPKDAFCVIALTFEDLFSCKTDLFVAGMAI